MQFRRQGTKDDSYVFKYKSGTKENTYLYLAVFIHSTVVNLSKTIHMYSSTDQLHRIYASERQRYRR